MFTPNGDGGCVNLVLSAGKCAPLPKIRPLVDGAVIDLIVTPAGISTETLSPDEALTLEVNGGMLKPAPLDAEAIVLSP